MSGADTGLSGWGVLELMGHRRLAGKVSEATMAGAPAIRIDIPGDEEGLPAITQCYAPSAYYCFTPTDEATARRAAQSWRPVEVARLALPAPREPDYQRCEPEEVDEL